MGSVGGYGYKPFLDITDALGGMNNTIETYIASDIEIPSSAEHPNAVTEMYYTPSDVDCNCFLNYGVLRSKNSDNRYKYTITENNNNVTLTLFDETNTSVESVVLHCNTNDGTMVFSNFNFAIRCGYSDIESPNVVYAGFSCTESGIIGMSPVVRYPVVWFTETRSIQIIQDCISVIKVKDDGVVVTKLKNSNNFLITKLPDSFYSKNVVNFDHTLNTDIIPLSDATDETQLLLDSVSFAHVPSNPLNPVSYLGDCTYIGMYAIHRGFIAQYGNDVGSDLFRKTADGQYTNAETLELYTNTTLEPYDSTTAYNINFEGGVLKWVYDSQTLKWTLNLCDVNDNVVDSWTLPSPRSPATGNPGSSQILQDVATAFLCKSGNNYYIVGEGRQVFLYDADGNILYDSTYNNSLCYVVLKKFNSSANQILNNATETIVEFDKTSVDDTSEEGSMPQDTDELNDNNSTWSKGDLSGENTGIRHNGDDIIDASNGELTHDESVGSTSAPIESGESPIPTAITTGMIKAFAPTLEELQKFQKDLNSDTWLTAIRNYLSNPMDIVISCHTCIAPALDKGTPSYLHYGIWSSSTSAEPYSMDLLDHQYYEVDMGFINLREYRNSYKDYPPFCNYKIYLPYIGIRDIDGRICVGKQLSLKYIINVITGDILATLNVLNENSQNISGYYTWQGNTLSPIPLKSTDYSNMINGAISTILSTATAGLTGNAMGLINTGVNAFRNGLHPDVKMLGTVSGSMSHCMYNTPYIIREYPYLSETNPYQYERLRGLSSNIGNKLLDNYVQNTPQFIKFIAQDLNLIKTNKKSLYATESEKQEIESLLAEGVYV